MTGQISGDLTQEQRAPERKAVAKKRKWMFTKDDVVLAGAGALTLVALIGLSYYGGWQMQKSRIDQIYADFESFFSDNPALVALKSAEPRMHKELVDRYKAQLGGPLDGSGLREIEVSSTIRRYVETHQLSAAGATAAHFSAIAKANLAYSEKVTALNSDDCVLAGDGKLRVAHVGGDEIIALDAKVNAATILAIADGRNKPFVAWRTPVSDETYNSLLQGFRRNGATPTQVSYLLGDKGLKIDNNSKCRSNLIYAKTIAQLSPAQMVDFFRMRFSTPPDRAPAESKSFPWDD